MIDWLARDPQDELTVRVAGHALPLVIRRHSTAKRMTLRLAPDGREVRITIPRWGRTADALAFAESRTDWLSRQHAAIPPAEPARNGGMISFRGECVTICLKPDAPRSPVLEHGRLVLGGPDASLGNRVRRWLQGEAHAVCSADLDSYCAIAKVAAPPLALSNAKRRWGSCSPSGSIRINWRLIMAPDYVRRSVVAHEVAHLVHLDHSPQFHAALTCIYDGDLDAANRWLKAEGRSLYRGFG